MKLKIHLFLFFIYCCFGLNSYAQDTEFPKGFIMHAKLYNGMITNFTKAADLYVGGAQLVPQFTLVEHKLRAGMVVGAFFAGKKVEAQLGPTISFKVKTIKASVFGSAANVNLSLDHLWGTGREKLLGGGVNLDLLNKLVLGFTVHREYNFNTWWFQTTLGLRISKKKKSKEPFNE